MNFYDDLVMQTQMNYSRHYPIYASGSTPYQLTDKKPLPYSEQIHRLVQEVKEADCVDHVFHALENSRVLGSIAVNVFLVDVVAAV